MQLNRGINMYLFASLFLVYASFEEEKKGRNLKLMPLFHAVRWNRPIGEVEVLSLLFPFGEGHGPKNPLCLSFAKRCFVCSFIFLFIYLFILKNDFFSRQRCTFAKRCFLCSFIFYFFLDFFWELFFFQGNDVFLLFDLNYIC